MTQKSKNIILFTVIAGVFVLIFVFFMGDEPDPASLVVTDGAQSLNPANTTDPITTDFLSLLLNVRTIKLDDSIFSDRAFLSLRDSSIILLKDGTEGRPNPFAPIGAEGGATSSVDGSATISSNETTVSQTPISATPN